MKTFFASILIAVLAIALTAQTLNLTWMQPAGYQSTLYEATNINGSWTAMGVVNPPVAVQTTNQVAFFYVAVAPTNLVNSDVIYSNDPNAENLKPADTNKPAMAYSFDGSGAIYGWSVQYQQWR